MTEAENPRRAAGDPGSSPPARDAESSLRAAGDPGSSPPARDAESSLRAVETALRHLNRRDRTVYEMRAHLERRGIDPQAADEAIEMLTGDGYLDDGRYARLFTQDKRNLEQWGDDRIRRALAERGVDRDLVTAALADSPEDETELDRALEILRRRFPDPPRERRDRDRALGVLVRKGYDSDVALDALAAHVRDPRAPSIS